jgi:hypothetical protein
MEIIKDNVELTLSEAQLVSTDDCDETMSIECNPDDNVDTNISDDSDDEYRVLNLTEIQYNYEDSLNDDLNYVINQLENIIIKTNTGENQIDLEIESGN